MPQIFAVGTRQPGVLISGAISVSGTAAGKTYFVHTSIPQTDLDDPTVTFSLDMQIRNPDLSWPPNVNVAITFVGGPNMGKSGGVTIAPGWMQSGNEVANQDVRFRLNVTGRAFDCGLDADPV